LSGLLNVFNKYKPIKHDEYKYKNKNQLDRLIENLIKLNKQN